MLDLSAPWDSLPLAVIDFETSGVTPGRDKPVQVGVARFEGRKCVAQWESLLYPGMPIHEAATAVHGITDDMVNGAPTLAEVAPQIFRLAQDAIPCAYNSTFDRAFLHAEITGTECAAFDSAFGWLCPLVVIREVDRYVGGKGRHKLEVVCKRWNVELTKAHSAAADAVATGELLYTLLSRGKVRSCSLGRMLSVTEQKRTAQEADNSRG